MNDDYRRSLVAVAPRFYICVRLKWKEMTGNTLPKYGAGVILCWNFIQLDLKDIRMTRRGVEANGEMCRILLEERYRGRLAVPAGETGPP